MKAALEEGAETYFSIPCKCKFSSLYLGKDKHKCLPDFIQIGDKQRLNDKEYMIIQK